MLPRGLKLGMVALYPHEISLSHTLLLLRPCAA